jgi:hypothetical protein
MSGSNNRNDWSALASHNERLVSALTSHSERLADTAAAARATGHAGHGAHGGRRADAPATAHRGRLRQPGLATAAALRLSRSSRILHRYADAASRDTGRRG